ncbi:MAG: hypothetical protein Q8N22_01425 [bacterium]|nr:hypothetical protein [bacterium]
MNQIDFENQIKIAISNFIYLHHFLLEKDVNERSITHKLAECLTPLFPEWDIDCEYNRVGDKLYNPKKIGLFPEPVSSDDGKAVTIYPDIIIHHRGKIGLDNNLAVIELKKNPNKKQSDKDIDKIRKIKKELEYQIGIFLKCSIEDIIPIYFIN